MVTSSSKSFSYALTTIKRSCEAIMDNFKSYLLRGFLTRDDEASLGFANLNFLRNKGESGGPGGMISPSIHLLRRSRKNVRTRFRLSAALGGANSTDGNDLSFVSYDRVLWDKSAGSFLSKVFREESVPLLSKIFRAVSISLLSGIFVDVDRLVERSKLCHFSSGYSCEELFAAAKFLLRNHTKKPASAANITITAIGIPTASPIFNDGSELDRSWSPLISLAEGVACTIFVDSCEVWTSSVLDDACLYDCFNVEGWTVTIWGVLDVDVGVTVLMLIKVVT